MLIALRTNLQPELIAVAASFAPCSLCARTDGSCPFEFMSCHAPESSDAKKSVWLCDIEAIPRKLTASLGVVTAAVTEQKAIK